MTKEKLKQIEEVIKNINITKKELDTVIHHLKECELALYTLSNKMSLYNSQYQILINES